MKLGTSHSRMIASIRSNSFVGSKFSQNPWSSIGFQKAFSERPISDETFHAPRLAGSAFHGSSAPWTFKAEPTKLHSTPSMSQNNIMFGSSCHEGDQAGRCQAWSDDWEECSE